MLTKGLYLDILVVLERVLYDVRVRRLYIEERPKLDLRVSHEDEGCMRHCEVLFGPEFIDLLSMLHHQFKNVVPCVHKEISYDNVSATLQIDTARLLRSVHILQDRSCLVVYELIASDFVFYLHL